MVVVDVVAGGRFLVAGDRLVLVESGDAPDGDRLFLGEDADGTPYFAVAGLLSGGVTLRDAGDRLDEREGGLAATAVALALWHARHGYAPATGRLTTAKDGGWLRTDDGGENVWPRTDPCVIVLVHDGAGGPDGRCLLGHNAAWATPGIRRFSCLAGFVEPGESAESAVVREIAEEVGVAVDGITYVASQPWPFPSSLMLGFLARADPDQPVRADEVEITHASWFTRRQIGEVLDGSPVVTDDGQRVGLPMNASIASFLVRYWLRAGPP